MWKEGEGLVLKFGGTSVSNPEMIQAAARRTASFARSGRKTAVVVSAMGGSTDELIELARATAPLKTDRRELDRLLATGEQQSSALLAMALSAEGCPARSFSGDEAGFIAEGPWGQGRILSVNPERVAAATAFGNVAVISGFQASTREGETITLGRGGSDLSAIALAGALGASECRIYTDVDGIYSADPRVVPGAVKLDRICWDECLEMSFCGASVLQARGIEMAGRLKMPVCVESSSEEREGTWIVERNIDEAVFIRSVASDDNLAVLTVGGGREAERMLMDALSKEGIRTTAITAGGSASFHIDGARLHDAMEICTRLGGCDVSVNDALARVSVIGPGAGNHPKVSGAMLGILSGLGATVHMLTSSALSVTCVVDRERSADAVRALHEEFIEKKGVFQCA
ncbi:MAG: aspartate kinase [Synergistaceae bacterium]|nr:aspartate kinase [Synergistota bacterium]NLM70397.1 aspartate kinase [Synergistaceae bacterium]